MTTNTTTREEASNKHEPTTRHRRPSQLINEDSEENEEDTHTLVNSLNDDGSAHGRLKETEVLLRTRSNTWLKKFTQIDGVITLVKIMVESQDVEARNMAIRSLRALASVDFGYETVLQNQDALNGLVTLLSHASHSITTKALSAQLLSLLCSSEHSDELGFLATLRAFENVHKTDRFSTLVQSLATVEDEHYRIEAVNLINALLVSSPNLSTWRDLVTEFKALNLEQIVQQIRSGSIGTELDNQIRLLEEELNDPEEETCQ